MTPAFYHLIPFGLEKTVLDSQLVTPALKLQAEGVNVHIILFEDWSFWWGSLFKTKRKLLLKRMKGLKTTVLPRVPRNILFLNTVVLFFIFQSHLRRRDPVVVHARGLQGSSWVMPLKYLFKSIRVISDVRGMEAEEYIYSLINSQGKLNVFQRDWGQSLTHLTCCVLKRADMRFCVSQSMKRHLMKWVGDENGEKWEHMPCAVDVSKFSGSLKNRNQKRSEMGVQGRIVFVYSGTYRDWQMPRASVMLFSEVKKIFPKAYLMILSPDVDRFEVLLRECGVSDADSMVKQVPFDEVSDFLSAADIGLLLREENPLNTYSCPTKFAEYLACGLHVIATGAIKDIADIIHQERVGTLIADLHDSVQVQEAVGSAVRLAELEITRIERSVSLSERLFDWGRFIPVMKKWYLYLAQEHE